MDSTRTPKKSRPAQESGDRLDLLRRAQRASDALDQGLPIPAQELNALAPRKRAGAAGARSSSRPDASHSGPQGSGAHGELGAADPTSTPKRAVGLVYSQEGRPGAHIVISSHSEAVASIIPMAASSPFERLLMGQQRLGRISTAQAQVEPTKALGKNVLGEIERQAKHAHLGEMIEVVLSYYKATAQEVQAQKSSLSSLSQEQFDGLYRAMSFAHDHVQVIQDPAFARKQARESEGKMREFYEQHGSTAMQVESEMAELAATPKIRKKGRKPG